MSFVVHVFHAPAVRTVEQAAAFVHATDTAHGPAPTAMFASFRRALCELIPGVDGAGRDDGLIPEGLDAATDDCVWTIGLNSQRLDASAMKAIGHAAAHAGLNVLDPQNAMLYRSDRRVIDGTGHEHALGPVTPQPPLPIADEVDFDRDSVCERIDLALSQRWARRGFAANPAESFRRFDRASGSVKQRVVVYANTRPDEVALQPGFEFGCSAVSAVWKAVLADHLAGVADSVLAGQDCDVTLRPDEFWTEPSERAQRFSAWTFAKSIDAVDLWIARFARWMDDEVFPLLDIRSVETPAALARLALAPVQMQRLYLRNDLSTFEIFSRLVLAAAFDRTRFDEWVAAARDHQSRTGRPFGGDRIHPSHSEALDVLVSYLKSQDFAAFAESLRGMG